MIDGRESVREGLVDTAECRTIVARIADEGG
jgi:hypothetical protein